MNCRQQTVLFFLSTLCQTLSDRLARGHWKIYILQRHWRIKHQEMYLSGNTFPTSQSSADLCSANAFFFVNCLRALSTQCRCPLCPSPNPSSLPSSTVAKWTRIDLWPSPAATQRKSSTSTRRKAASPRTRMLTWWCGTPRWQGERPPAPTSQQKGRCVWWGWISLYCSQRARLNERSHPSACS